MSFQEDNGSLYDSCGRLWVSAVYMFNIQPLSDPSCLPTADCTVYYTEQQMTGASGSDYFPGGSSAAESTWRQFRGVCVTWKLFIKAATSI